MSFIPTTILTGFLGSGKTTLLKRILSQPHGHRTAVIENEFGEENIDAEILVAEVQENIVQLSNGCVCCRIREDLRSTLQELAQSRRSGRLAFDRVVIETTGLADPGPVVQTFFMDERIAESYTLDSVVTLVDSCHAEVQLNLWQEARRQVGFADRLFISKSELATSDALTALRHRLAQMNPRAPQRLVHFGEIALSEVFDLNGFKLTSRLDIDPSLLGDEASHSHGVSENGDQLAHCERASHDDVRSFVYRSARAFDPAKLQRFLGDLVDKHGPSLLRYKGVLNLHDTPRKVILQGVHQLMNSDRGPRWLTDEVRESRIVFIGMELPEADIRRGLNACLT